MHRPPAVTTYGEGGQAITQDATFAAHPPLLFQQRRQGAESCFPGAQQPTPGPAPTTRVLATQARDPYIEAFLCFGRCVFPMLHSGSPNGNGLGSGIAKVRFVLRSRCAICLRPPLRSFRFVAT